jgi:hypothetical protein
MYADRSVNRFDTTYSLISWDKVWVGSTYCSRVSTGTTYTGSTLPISADTAGLTYDTFTVPVTGTYLFQVGGSYTGGSTGRTGVLLQRGGSTVANRTRTVAVGAAGSVYTTEMLYQCNANDTVQFLTDGYTGGSYVSYSTTGANSEVSPIVITLASVYNGSAVTMI